MDTISTEVADRVLTITLDRPDRLNAFTYEMHLELIEAFDQADADPDVRAVIVTGRGRGFCAGADLGGGGQTFDASAAPAPEQQDGASHPAPESKDSHPAPESKDRRHRDEGGLVSLRIFQCTKPVIAAINGPSVGVGATITLPMDIRLAAESAKFGFVFARRGLVPEAASSWFLPRVVGVNRALEWCFTGRVFGPDEALAAGLVRSVHPDDELLDAAHAIAAEIVANTSAVSVSLTRQMLWRMLGAPHPMDAHQVDSQAIYTLGQGADVREGVMSFLEKRPPDFPMQVPGDLPDFFPWWDEPEF